MRNGYLPAREIQTGIGDVPVKVPRVRDREPKGDGVVFHSKLIPPYLRRAKSVEELLPYQAKYPKASACLEKDRHELLAFYDSPPSSGHT